MLDFTFLTKEQCFDSSKQLEIFKKRGIIGKTTDFCILLGGGTHTVLESSRKYSEDDPYFDYTLRHVYDYGVYWTKSSAGGAPVGVGQNIPIQQSYQREICARPVLSYSSIRQHIRSTLAKDGITEGEFGEYPQNVPSKKLQVRLENAYNYNKSSIRKTGKIYTTDSLRITLEGVNNGYVSSEKFSGQFIEEYLFDNGKKYVRVKANFHYGRDEKVLSDGEEYKNGDYVWVEVQPIKWLIDQKNDIVLPEKLVFAGIPFNYEKNYNGDFQTTFIKEYMNTIFSKDIIPSKSAIEIELKETIQQNKKKVLEEIIKILSENNLEYETFIKMIDAGDNRRYISECMDRYFLKDIIPSNVKEIMPEDVISEKNKVKVKTK